MARPLGEKLKYVVDHPALFVIGEERIDRE